MACHTLSFASSSAAAAGGGGGGGELDEEASYEFDLEDPISSPLIFRGSLDGTDDSAAAASGGCGSQNQLSVVAVVAAALKKSLVLCNVGPVVDDGSCSSSSSSSSSMDISWPTDVRHDSHVTFDRFDGFLGLPSELLPELPGGVPSASVSVFGVSTNSMQCSYDSSGNSVPTILLSMQRYLYSQGGLQVEGIFRINAENSQELYVRDQLNKGIVSQGVDLHCLAGLIKAWFRELPTGVLDSLTPDQVMHCNTEEECSQLVRMLPPTEAALLDWAINLMADVVENEHHNKMNARSIAMVFAPNMTQMADPLTALIHAVQVMNLLKTLIMKRLREREEASAESRVFQSCSESPSNRDGPDPSRTTERSDKENVGNLSILNNIADSSKFLVSPEHPMESDSGKSFPSFGQKTEAGESHEFKSGKSSPFNGNLDALEDRSKFEYGNGDAEGILQRLSFRKGVRKLSRHPVFHLIKPSKNPGDLGILNPTEDGRQAWA